MADDAYMHAIELVQGNLAEIVEDLEDDLERCPRVAELAARKLVK